MNSAKVGHKAVLVYPQFDTQDTFWSYAASFKLYSPPGEFGLPKSLLPPLGLMGLFNYLKPLYDELTLIDKNVDPRPLADLIEDTDHVYLSGMLTQQNHLLKCAEIAKNAGKTVIVGGPIVSRDSPLMEIADHLVENEAEMVVDSLLDGLRKGCAEKYYQGLFAPAEKFFRPDYSSINLSNYAHMAIQISRGCPESCEFCDAPARFGKSHRVMPYQDLLSSFSQMKCLGWTGPVFVVDDNFIGNPKMALQVLKQLFDIGEEIGLHHPKYTELTLRLADDLPVMQEIRHWFKKTNFINGFYGVETPNKASLQETGKRQNLRGEKSLTEKLRFISEQTGTGVMMGMIYGFDHDTEETVDEIIRFVNSTHAPVIMAGLLNALPSTRLLERMKEEGRYVKYSSRNNSDGVINFIPWNFSVRQAESNYLKILEGIYHPDAFFNRVLRHLQLIDANGETEFRSVAEKLNLLIKILSRQNAKVYWRNLPKAIAIALKRFGFNAAGYARILSEYFALCGQYTHFANQVAVLRNNLAEKNYQPWQQVSWLELQNSKINEIQPLEFGRCGGLQEQITIRLDNGFEISGARLEILRYFVEHILTKNLQKLPERAYPEKEKFIEMEVDAYRQAHGRHPKILDGVDFNRIEATLKETLMRQTGYVQKMRSRLKRLQAIEANR